MKRGVLLLPLLLVTGLIDGLTGFTIPASSHCKQEDEHFPCHKTYYFDYNVQTTFTIPASADEEGIAKIDCKVQLDAEGECKYTLKVKSCSISEQPSIISQRYSERIAAKSKEFSTAMERYVVGFTMSDGIVEKLMAHTSEPISILNFKRGIISSFITKKKFLKDDARRLHSDMRPDVQGICPVIYRNLAYYGESRSKLYMTKDTSKCHFPSRTNSPYSPFSLIWNTSVIHNEVIHFYSSCEYLFNKADVLNGTDCRDVYTLHGQSKDNRRFTAVNTIITQKLTLSGESDLKSENVYKTLTDYQLKHIQFEFEKVEQQHGVIPDIKQKVQGLMDKLLIDPEKPIKPYSGKAFDKLVEILRHSENLNNVLDNCWISSTCPNDKYSDKEIQLGKIWMIALIQCNRVQCTKAFRSMLDWDPKYLQHVVTNNDLDWIFFAWANAKISDFPHIEAIIDIVEHKYSNRFAIGAVSSIINNFRKSHTDEELREQGNIEPKHRSTLENFVKFIKKPIGVGCKASEGYKNIDVAAALHAYANVVPLYEFVSGQRLDLDQFQKCINGKEDHWPITISALQATRFVRPSKELHTLLWKAFKDPSLRHEDHVIAYKILADKFGGSDFLEEILNFLEKSEEKGVDYNMRTYIVTHLRKVAKDRRPHRAEFSKAIRKAMVYKANLFRAIPDEKPIAKTDYGKDYNYNARNVPWDIRVDDDEIFEEGLFSTYDEEHFNYGSSVFGGFGYGLAASSLFKKGSVFPYAIWAKDYVKLFGQTYNVSQLAIFTKGLEEFFNVLSSQFSDNEDAVKSWAGITKAKAIFENVVAGTQHGSKLELPKFPYSVNEEVLKRLAALHTEKVNNVSKTEESLDLVYQFGVYDNYLHQISLQEIPELVSKMLTDFNARMNSPYKTNPLFWKVVEAETVIPTIIGIPLNWTTDAYWFSNSKLETKHSPKLNYDEEVVFNISGSFSGLATFKLGVYLDLPGYVNYGAKSVSKISTSVGASVDFKLNIKEKKFKVQLELPQRPMDLLSYKRVNYLVRHYEDVDIPDFSKKRRTEDSCSYTLSSLLGFKLCHNYSYVQLPDDLWGSNMQCSSLAGNSHWSYTTDYIAKHKVALQFGLHTDQVDGKTNIETYVKSRDPNNADNFYTVIKWIHEVKKGEFKSQITAPVLPTFNILATREPLGDNGYHVKIQATAAVDTLYIDLQSQDTFEYVAESSMKSQLTDYPNSKQSLVPVTRSTLNVTNKLIHYGYSYKQYQFPKTTYTDYKLQYKSLKEHYKSWPEYILRHSDFWDEDGGTWIKFRRELKTDHKYDDDTKQSYNVIKLPKSVLKLVTYNGPTPDNNLNFAFNLTRQQLPSNNLQNFINFTSSIKKEYKDDKMLFVLKANTTLPYISLATKFIVTQEQNPIQEANITWIVRKEHLHYKPNFAGNGLKWWAPNTDIFTSEKTYARANILLKEDSNPEWKKIKERLRSGYVPLINAANLEYYSHFDYHKSGQSDLLYEIDFQSKPTYVNMDEARYRRSFSIKSPTEKFDYDANLSLDFGLETEVVLWKSTLRLPNQEPTFYLFNVTSPPAKGYIYVTEDLTSKPLKRNTQIVVSYLKPVGEISINSQSPDDPLFNLELKAKYSAEATTIKVKHHFVDIDFESSRINGYTSKTDFKSKDLRLVQDMQWLVKYPNAEDGVTITFHLTDFGLAYYVISHSDWNATRLLIDICSQKNCTISDIDSDNFIAEIELSLEDPQILTRTVTYNPDALNEIVPFIGNQISMVTRGFAEYYGRNSPENSILTKLYQFTSNVFKAVFRETSDLLWQFLLTLVDNLFTMFYIVIDPIIQIATYLPTTQVLRSQSAGYSWCSYVLGNYEKYYRPDLAERFLDGVYTPGPIPGKSYVVKTQLPVYWTQFNRWPLQLSPMFRRKMQEANEDSPIFGEAPVSHFNDEEYERHALFTSSGDIYTFDGRVRHFNNHLRESCPYLLSHDYDEGKFSIYYHFSNMHFLFPELSVKLVPTGQIYVNETVQVDLPFSSWNGNIRMVRQENLTELTTTYGLKVVCSNNDFYCVFYTTDNKFSSLTGLLGNNNDNPLDEPKDVKQYELGESYICRDSPMRKSYSTGSSFQLRWFDLLWQPKSPTLACHDIVSPKDIFASAYLSDSYSVPCSLMNGYLALCGAKGVSVGTGPCFKCKSTYPLDRKWESKVENKIDVIFIIDLTYRKSSKNFLKGLETLANSFNANLPTQLFSKSVSFGLVGYKGKGQWKEPQQHTMNGKLLGNYKEFTQYGLQTLTFDGPSSENLTAGISAVEFAAEHYNLGDTSTHIFVIITPKDSPIEGFSTKSLLYRYGYAFDTLHVFTNYKEIIDKKLFGLKADGTAFSKDEGKFNFKPDKNPASYPKGVLAEIAGKTKGTVWQLRNLEDDEPQSKIFNNLVSLDLLEQSKLKVNQCRNCYCTSSDIQQPHNYCEKATCEGSVPDKKPY